jgi:hypothetical protein
MFFHHRSVYPENVSIMFTLYHDLALRVDYIIGGQSFQGNRVHELVLAINRRGRFTAPTADLSARNATVTDQANTGR